LKLLHLKLKEFRNIASAKVEPCPRFNIFTGENGQGKSNLLEAIYWLSTLKAFRARRLRELIRFGEQSCLVEGRVDSGGLEHRLAVRLQGGERSALREGKRAQAPEYFGALATILFTPESLSLIHGRPELRRRFLDRAIFTGTPSYLAEVQAFRRALEGRNRLLRAEASDPEISAYEAILAITARRLNVARREYVEELRPHFLAAFSSILGEEYQASLKYRPGIEGEEPEELEQVWAEERGRDRQRGFTQRGPQTDELLFKLLDRPARAYASQGQQRAMVLALKIAEIELLKERSGITPILLLDDVSSELDPRRNARLFKFLDSFQGQVFITTTDRSFLSIQGESRYWSLKAGEVTEEAI